MTAHFNAHEFKCKCGQPHDFELSDELVTKLEKLYEKLNCSKIIVTSGYRCAMQDKKVGGSGNGQHTKGTAADICCYGQDGKPISSKIVCCTAQDLCFGGIANIDSDYIYTHVDVTVSGSIPAKARLMVSSVMLTSTNAMLIILQQLRQRY